MPLELRNMRVLVADDNKALREVLVEQLESFSLRAEGVESGAAAIDELKRAQISGEATYELVFMDWLMEGENGIQTAERIMADDNIQKNPRLFSSPPSAMKTF